MNMAEIKMIYIDRTLANWLKKLLHLQIYNYIWNSLDKREQKKLIHIHI